jgi:transposase
MQETREIRALAIAATTQLRPGCDGWRVPSQSGNGSYKVDPDAGWCSCPDHETRAVECKHILAVRFTLRRERGQAGAYTITRAAEVTYTQQWSAYNAAQCEEKDRFLLLLADLCSSVPQPVRAETRGRKPLSLSDMTFAAAFKVYSRFSSRRFTCDLRAAHAAGLIGCAPHFNSVSNYLSDERLTPILQDLIVASARPLATVESAFAVDSSGFSTSRHVTWFNKKHGGVMDNKEWVKLHLMCGVSTNIVTSAEVTGWTAADTTYFRPLMERTAETFTIEEVSADKGYLSKANADTAEKFGATPYIPFKVNSKPSDQGAWGRMYHRFAYDRETFLAHYHKRSNVETVFSMIKAKFGDSVLSRSDTGQMNEALCKVLAHNICVVISAIHELGIEPSFAAERLTLRTA